MTATLIKTCILLTFGGDPVVTQEIIPSDSSYEEQYCPGSNQGWEPFRHIKIERSRDLIHWEVFVEGDFPEYSSMTIIETNTREHSFLKITRTTP